MIEWEEYKGDDIAPWKTISIDGFPLIHMQSTGLKDTNGIEIYDGDILKYKDKKNLTGDFDGESVFLSDDATWRTESTEYVFAEVSRFSKVIGNIHENPELLK